MESNELILFLLSSIGVLNGVLLSIYFLFILKPREKHHFFLGCLLAVLSIRIGKSVIFYFFDDVAYLDLYLQIGLSACFLIGPFLYIYICYLFKQKTAFFDWKVHILLMLGIITFIGVRYPFFEYNSLWSNYFMYSIYGQWLCYLLASAVLLRKFLPEIEPNQAAWINQKTWILSIYVGNIIIWAAYVFSGLTSYMLGAVSFTFLLYLLIFLLFTKTSKREEVLASVKPKYGGKVIEETTSQTIIQDLNKLFEKEEVYCNPKLNLQLVAKQMAVSPHLLSQVINEKMSKNFSQVVHEYRIKKAKTMILENEQFTLESIGYDCGYKAKSSFYTAFKNETGTTPAQFKKAYQKKE